MTEVIVEKNRLSKKDLWSVVIMPVVVVVIASGMAIWLQDRSFRRNQMFTAKLNQIVSGQDSAVQILREVDAATRQIRGTEKWIRDRQQKSSGGPDEATFNADEFLAPSIEVLKDSKVRLDALVAVSQGVGGGKAIDEAAQQYSTRLAKLLQCLSNNIDFRCAERNFAVVPAMRDVVVAHTTAANELIQRYD